MKQLLLLEFDERRYKFGITLNYVQTRYKGYEDYEVLYKKLTLANTIKKISRKNLNV